MINSLANSCSNPQVSTKLPRTMMSRHSPASHRRVKRSTKIGLFQWQQQTLTQREMLHAVKARRSVAGSSSATLSLSPFINPAVPACYYESFACRSASRSLSRARKSRERQVLRAGLRGRVAAIRGRLSRAASFLRSRPNNSGTPALGEDRRA